MRKILSILLNVSFNICKERDVLILDLHDLNLKIKNKKILYFNYDKIYFFYLSSAIFTYLFKNPGLNIRQLYKRKIFSTIKPKIVLANNLNNRGFEFKKIYPKAKVIIYQFGYINNNFVKKHKINNSKHYSDYFLSFHKKDSKMLSKIYNSKFLEFGSIRNNNIQLTTRKTEKKNIVFISEYSPGFIIHNKNQKFIVKILSEYCEINNINFIIALRLTRRDKKKSNITKGISINNEINFFKKIIGEKFDYMLNLNSYEVCNNANLIVSLSSNLGIEMIARKKKVLFLPFNQSARKYEKENIYFKNLNNEFCHNKHDKNKIYNKIDQLFKYNSNKWKKIINKNMTLIEFDKNNSKLKKLVQKILYEKK